MDLRPIKRKNSAPKRILKRGLLIIIFLGVPLITFRYAFRLDNVSVMGTTRYTPDEIRQKFIKTDFDSNTLVFYLKYKYFVDVRIPFIEKFDIKMKGRNSADIRLYEKRVIGCVEFMGEYLYFDKDGIVVESSTERLPDIPVVKGLEFSSIVLNEKLKVQKDELFDVILNLAKMIERYSLKVQSISFNQDYEVTMDCGSVVALLGKRNAYDEVLSELKSILADKDGELKDIMDKQEGTVLELDMRKYTKDTAVIMAKPKK